MTDIRPAGPFSPWEWALANRYLRSKRKNGGVTLISAISFIGISLAVAVLIIVMSVMNGFRDQLLTRILGFNGHAYVQGSILYDPNRDATVKRLEAMPGVKLVTPMVEAQSLVRGEGQYIGAIVRGVSAKGLRQRPIITQNIKEGSLAGFGEGEYGGDLVVIGERLAMMTGVRAGDALTVVSPAGSATAFGSAPISKQYTVAATFGVGMSDYDQAFIYMPLEQSQILFGKGSDVDVVELLIDKPDEVEAIKPALSRAAGPGAVVTDWRDKNAQFWGALQVERNVMRLILLLIIAIAALNIISGLVMLVKNKGRDIAILRTIGAGQGAIMRIFFMSGAAVGVIATPVGLTVGVLFCIFIKQIQDFVEWATGAEVFNASVYFLESLPAKIDWSEVAIVTAWTLFMSFITTLYPAWRASRIDPVEALRYE